MISLRKTILSCALFGAMIISGIAMATTNTATQTVSFEVRAINALAVSGNSPSLVIETAVAGQAPDDAVDSSTNYAITTNGSNKKITGSIDLAMPAGVTLSVSLAAPSGGGASAGSQALSATPVDLVTGIAKLAAGKNTITYTLSATAEADVILNGSRTVTYTLVDG